jgi:hypothetical protein
MFPLNRLKIITIDYKAGISPGVLDAIPENVVVVSPKDYKHVFKKDWSDTDYILFLGHDFLHFLYDKRRKVRYWKNIRAKKIIWCFERINCIVDEWRKRSLKCYSNIEQFADHIFVADEEDYRRMPGVHFLPQWASPRFKNDILFDEKKDNLLFTGQFGTIGYEKRTALLSRIKNDPDMGSYLHIANSSRVFTWDDYINNLIKYKYVLNPMGNLVSFNTKAYETIVAGNILFQQIDDRFQLHREILSEGKEVIYFYEFADLKEKFLKLVHTPSISVSIHQNCKDIIGKHVVFPRLETIFVTISDKTSI